MVTGPVSSENAMVDPGGQELTTAHARGLHVALHALVASGPFSSPQESSPTRPKKAVSHAVALASGALARPPLRDVLSCFCTREWCSALVKFHTLALLAVHGQLGCSDSSLCANLFTSAAAIVTLHPLSSVTEMGTPGMQELTTAHLSGLQVALHTSVALSQEYSEISTPKATPHVAESACRGVTNASMMAIMNFMAAESCSIAGFGAEVLAPHFLS
eukprot:CAMPEP_0181424508 /NCGR_PEP_ID=MMETSP1110-20121109/14682_1 /TAXON_ID=174948 /ORGANISM="Symbiodinium sp., Strain CCMP421" /LENGTH=216 /DNA_ID=CAMNT_0023547671 /DNA_START=277 /DNA_END=924 /DNA_ORIENTATION=-